MATLYKRGNLWWARWYRHDGKRVSASTKTDKKRDAERIGAELEAKDRRGTDEEQLTGEYQRILREAARDAQLGKLTGKAAETYITQIRRVADPSFRALTIAKCVDGWVMDQAARVGESTANGYRQMRDAVKKVLGKRYDAPLPDFTHTEAQQLLRDLKTGRTAATANMHFRAFRRALQSAVRAKQITDNPAEGVRPLPEIDSVERAPWSQAEVRQMLDAPTTSEEWRGAILIAAHTGLRLGDVVQLGRGHIEGQSIIIRPKKTKRVKKNLIVPMSPAVQAWITGKEGPFFPSLKDAKPGVLSTWFDRLRDNAKVPKTIEKHGVTSTRTFHSFRHSFASWMAEADIHPDVRQKLTGHSDAGIHALYSHHDKALANAIGKLPVL